MKLFETSAVGSFVGRPVRSFLLIFAVWVCALPLASQAVSSTVLVSPGSGNTSSPSLAADQNLVVVTWVDGAQNRVRSSRSLDGGATWSSPLFVDDNVTGQGAAPLAGKQSDRPSLYLSGNNAYQVWESDRNGGSDLYFARSTDGAISWDSELRLDDSGPVGLSHGIRDWVVLVVPGTQDQIHVLFTVDPGTPPALQNEELYLVSSLDSGQTFGPAVSASNNNGLADVDGLALHVEALSVHVAWTEDRFSSGQNEVFYRRSSDGGTSWDSVEMQVDASGPMNGNAFFPTLDGSGQTIALGWQEEIGSAVEQARVAVSVDGGSSFSSDQLVGDYAAGLDDVDFLTLRVLGDVLVAAWRDDRGGANSLYASSSVDAGVSWAPSTLLGSASVGAPCFIEGCTDGDAVGLTWVEGTPGRARAAFSAYGQLWTPPIDVSANSGDVDAASVAYSPFWGRFVQAWLADDLMPGNNDLYAAAWEADCERVVLTFGESAPLTELPQVATPINESATSYTPILNPDTGDVFFDYAPLDDIQAAVPTATSHPAHVLTVFLPETSPPSGARYPTLLYSTAGAFRQGVAMSTAELAPMLSGALEDGWAVVTVGTTGIDSSPIASQLPRCEPAGLSPPACRDANLWCEPDDDASSAWNDFHVFSGEKDMVWARQYLAANADELHIDNDRVFATGTSTGAIYSLFLAFRSEAWDPAVVPHSLSSQSQQDPAIAGVVGFEVVSWMRGLAPNTALTSLTGFRMPGFHWPTFGSLDLRADWVNSADAVDLDLSSPSRWVRSSTRRVPCFLATGDGIYGSTPFARMDATDYLRDGTSTPVNDPLLSFVDDPVLNLHDPWHALILMQDLQATDPVFQDRRSKLFLRADANWGHIPTSLSVDGATVPSGPEDVPLIDGEYASCGPCISIDNVALSVEIREWLNREACHTKRRFLSCRNGGTNYPVYQAIPRLKRASFTAVVNLDDADVEYESMEIWIYDAPGELPLGSNGDVILGDALPTTILGPFTKNGEGVAKAVVPIPKNLLGTTIYTQAILLPESGSLLAPAMTNAQDIHVAVLGLPLSKESGPKAPK